MEEEKERHRRKLEAFEKDYQAADDIAKGELQKLEAKIKEVEQT